MGHTSRRHGPQVLIMVMIATGCTLVVPFLASSDDALARPHLSWPLFVVFWVLLESTILNIHFGDVDNAEEFILTEIGLATGLLLVAPLELILVSLLVPVGAEIVLRRRSAVKQVFNASNRLVEVGVALSVYHAFLPADPLSGLGWLALTGAVTASGLVTLVNVSLVLMLAAGLPAREFLSGLISAPVLSFTCATLGFVGVLALQSGSSAQAPLGFAFLALLVLVWSINRLTERQTNLAFLHALGARLGGAGSFDGILEVALDGSNQLLLARQAGAYVPDPRTGLTRRVTRTADGTTRETSADSPPAIADGVAADRSRVSASAALGEDATVVLTVEGRASGARRFGKADARLLDMVTRQAALSLRSAQLIDQLRHDSLHDPLTGIANRRNLLLNVEETLEARGPFVVVWLGLRGFEVVNAALGHSLGDALLVQMGRRLVESAGQDGLVARVGGDEFAVLLPGADAMLRGQQVVGCVGEPFLIGSVPIVVRVSAGVTEELRSPRGSAEDVLRRADMAMRHARSSERTLETYSSDLETSTPETLTLAGELRQAIEGGELRLHAQPQIRLRDDRPTGVEMLVRWQHPRLGLLGPSAFIPLAEQTGLDRPLTAWVLEAAISALATWAASHPDLTASVNASPGALVDGGVADLTRSLLEKHGIAGDRLVIEVTESSPITRTTVAAGVMADLAALGVHLSIDDFGTGFSSLSHLRRLPVHEVKIDRSFVTGMLSSDNDAAVVRSVILLARGLGLTVVAEGIEDAATLEVLRGLGADLGQGYHVAPPMPLEVVPLWLADRAAAQPTGRPS